MTAPRQILAGTTYLVTRRCFQRQFLLRPSPMSNQIFRYVLAVAAQRFAIQIHAYCVMSNHFHLVVTDPEARLPAFEQYLDSLVARAMNALLGRWESFWAPSSYSAVALQSPDDIVAKVAYTLANPVAAGLARRPSDWPGASSRLDSDGTSAIARPDGFFRPRGPMPATAHLDVVPPPGFASAEQYRARIAAALAAAERQGAADQVVRSDSPHRTLPAPSRLGPRRELRPRIAARDKWKRIEALTRLKEFLATYRVAWRALCAGDKDAVFPAGTYRLRVTLGVVCAPACAPLLASSG
jgi:REP element-mobilizing transposase RayT